MPTVEKEKTCCGGCFCRFKCEFCQCPGCCRCPDFCLDFGTECVCCFCVCGCVPAPCGCLFDKFTPFCCRRGKTPYPPGTTIVKECTCFGEGCNCGIREGCACSDFLYDHLCCCFKKDGCCCKAPKCNCCKCCAGLFEYNVCIDDTTLCF